MKIINNTDINNLIIFSKKNLGIYKLVYKEQKKLYWMSVYSALLAIIFFIVYVLLCILRLNLLLEKLCFIICLLISILSLCLLHNLDKSTKEKHLNIQKYRFDLLKEYYDNKHFFLEEIKIINKQLNKKIERNEKQKTTILIIFGILILPIWEVFIQYIIIDFTSLQFFKIILFSFFVSLIVIAFIKFGNRWLYLYEENIYIKNNIMIIENLIYLNNYIIQEKEENIRNGRRRRRGC